MQGRSALFDATVSKPHTAVAAANIIQNNGVVARLAVHSGSVTADRTAAQMRSFQVEVSDPTGTLTPVDMNSLLAPFSRMQLLKGVRNSSTATQSVQYPAVTPWTPSGASTGVFVSTKIGSDGSLTLGP
jgi:hypothetical protein